MIVAKLQGGLGNQLFQWAFARSLSNLYNVSLYLDTSFYNQNIPGVTKRNFSLNKFPNLKYDLFENAQNNGKQFIRFSEPQSFTKLNYNSLYNYYLDGYFQSEDYFKDSSDIIREDLSPNVELIEKYPIVNKNNISLHIRRTDYITSNGYHPVQSLDYYKSSIEMIGDYDHIFVFSDDINWCKENLKFDNMIFIEGNDEVEDIWLMSLCKNNIIANSSFSWWSAWLNKNENKKVIYPKNWFGPQVNSLVSVPKNWIKN